MSNEDDDIRLFREAVGPVRRLDVDRAAPQRPRPSPRARQFLADERQVLTDMLSEHADSSDLQAGDALQYCRPGVQRTVFRKLRRGEYRLTAELDLHGMRVEHARQALHRFLREARHQGERCVRIIHGKGYGSRERGPVLKALVNEWLRQRDEVLAFCSARPADGGTGAVYVLLRR